jgi:predicted kinase
MELILVRGLPGSGKSTFAKSLGCPCFEADDYFVSKEGKYIFDGSKIKLAHEWCKGRVGELMKEGIKKIAVSNTFTQEWEMDDYYQLASNFGYVVYSVIVENRHNGTNVHGVPEDKLKIMKERFQVKL